MSGDGPTLNLEHQAFAAGEHVVVGLDEVGRGAWAGPVSVGAVAVTEASARSLPSGLRDSKKLTPSRRTALFDQLAAWSHARPDAEWSVGSATSAECDLLGMTAAVALAAQRALDGLSIQPDRLLVDGRRPFTDAVPTTTVVRGDDMCTSIAAASIVAKVTRDTLMAELAATFSPYEFSNNKGYPAPVHRAALVTHGPCAIHRLSWAPLRALGDVQPLRNPLWCSSASEQWNGVPQRAPLRVSSNQKAGQPT